MIERVKDALEQARLEREQAARAHPPGSLLDRPPRAAGEETVPPALYTETQSGQQLADLVGALHAEHEALARELPATASTGGSEVKFGETTLSVHFDDLSLADEDPLSATAGAGADDDAARRARMRLALDDEISQFTLELEARFRRYVEAVKAQERARYHAQLKAHAGRLQKLAEQQLRAKLATIRERYRAAHKAQEHQLRERYQHLIGLANKVTQQKAGIYEARRQLEDKLRQAEQVHHELAQIGLSVTRQLSDLESLIPSERVPD